LEKITGLSNRWRASSGAFALEHRSAAGRPAAGPGAAPKRRPVQRWGFRVAAAAALGAFVVVLFFVLEREASTRTVTAAGDSARVVELADGSTVRLMPGGTLSYVDPEADAALDRRATLEAGRAFFDVASARKGFLLETPTAQVRVLGTRFGVTAEERSTRVVLAFGRVALASKAASSAPVTLRPGQQSRVAAGARPTTPTAVDDLSEALAWTGLFVFRGAPARVVAEQLAAHYDTSVELAQALREKEVTGTFDRSRSLRETLRTVAAALGARVRPLADGGYVLVEA
jgi:ferric-dicitrate binding protein FerR (iron transport regulator)